MLSIQNVKKYFPSAKGTIKAVDGVSLDVASSSIVGLVGESGSGKSTLGKMIVGLHDKSEGQMFWNGEPMPKHFRQKDFLHFSREIQMIFQDPFSALNPKMPVWQILEEPCLLSRNKKYLQLSAKQRLAFIQDYLVLVGLRPEFYKRYPHEFSGGQQQRLGIARALMQEPRLLVCDEPISSLDVSVQAQIVNLLKSLHKEMGMGILFIAHDLAMVNYLCDEVAVMYSGKIVEQGSREQIFFNALHPYTQLLLASNPGIHGKTHSNVTLIQGEIPSPINRPEGCAFASRCWKKTSECELQPPELLVRQFDATGKAVSASENTEQRKLACYKPGAA